MKDHTFGPYPAAPRPWVDLDTVVVLDHAVVSLADRRYLTVLNSTVQLHLLASLTAQAEAWVSEQVQITRDNGATWTDIGRLLGISATVARQRHSHTTTTRP